MANFVLIHGAMHGGWCWERIVPMLQAHGHAVLAPDLPGLGNDHTAASDVTLENWGKFVANTLQRVSGRTILVGHSLGGMAISQAAEYAPDRVAALVYLSAVMLRNGKSAADIPEKRNGLQLKPSPDGQYMKADPNAALMAFYGETEDDWRKRALERLVPQPTGILSMQLALSSARYGAVKRVYIECLRDQALALDAQRAMQADLPCDEKIEIDTDHSPFYSRPEETCARLVEIASKYH